jgi:hypothetical protein
MEGHKMKCQLESLPGAETELPFNERIPLLIRKKVTYTGRTIIKIIKNPKLLVTKSVALLGFKKKSLSKKSATPLQPRQPSQPIGLKPGDKVQVKPYKEILKTLDEERRCEGLPYMESTMGKYCGGSYTVRKRVNYFFDERRWRMYKVKNVVILEGVYCESSPGGSESWAGCDRTCFLFWKEAWLEKLF